MKPITVSLRIRLLLAALALCAAGLVTARAGTYVTFTIDMSTETATPVTSVWLSGAFFSWSEPNTAYPLTNDPTGPNPTYWSQEFLVTDPPTTIEQCKFQDNTTGWEPLSNNREFVLGPANTPQTPQVLPLTQWNVSNWPVPTNWVTFQLDMSEQIAFDNFTNDVAGNSVAASGDFAGWGTADQLTNNPSASGLASNLYTGTFPVVGYLPVTINAKYRVNNLDGGYESPASTAGNNRVIAITNASQVLPVVSYDDLGLGDLVYSPVTVTFSVDVPDQTPTDTGGVFTKGTDSIYINGTWLNWAAWGYNALPASQQMVEVGSSDIYTNSFVIPRGNSIYLDYQYSIDGFDNENGFQTNHIREIRSYGPTYAFPQDVFSWNVLQPGDGNPYPNPGLAVTNIVEPDFGYLAIGKPVAGSLPITWLGRPAVTLQNTPSLSGGVWTNNSATDALQATNWPNANKIQFFRLIKN